MHRARPLFACLLVGLAWWTGSAASAQEAPSPTPTRPEPRDQIVLSGDVIVRRGEVVGEVVVVHGTATVAGVVHGDVVVIDGEVSVTGQVSGSVVAVNGPVTIGPNAQVLEDVIARDRLRVARGARIDGSVREGAAFTFRTPVEAFGAFAAWLAVAVSTLVLGALLLLVAPRGAEAVAAAALDAPWASAGIGLVVFVGVPIVGVLAVASLVGMPFGLALLLALLLLYFVGFAWSVFSLGRVLWHVPRSRWIALVIGWSIVVAVSAVPFVGGVVWFAGAIFGLGAMTIAAWRVRGIGGRHRPGGKMPAERAPAEPTTQPQVLVTERAMGREGTGI